MKHNIVKNKVDIIKLVRPNVLAMKPYSSARDEFKDFMQEMVFLDANENPHDSTVNRYPDPQQQSLKEAFAAKSARKKEEILLGNGSDEVLDLIFRVFCEPNKDSVITLPPTYGMYKVLSDTNAIATIEVPLTKDFQPDVQRILKIQDINTKLLFLCSPNNPTGNCLETEYIQQLIEGFNGIVIIDEAYIDFASHKSWVEKMDDYNNLIITQTLSKAYGMAGIRLGICYASSQIISLLNKIKPPYNINSLTQQYAYGRLQNRKAIFKEIETLLMQRTRLSKALGEVSFVKKVFHSDANFILIRVDDANRRYQQLIEKGIVVRNRSKQLGCENTLRITVGTQKENDILIKELNQL